MLSSIVFRKRWSVLTVGVDNNTLSIVLRSDAPRTLCMVLHVHVQAVTAKAKAACYMHAHKLLYVAIHTTMFTCRVNLNVWTVYQDEDMYNHTKTRMLHPAKLLKQPLHRL